MIPTAASVPPSPRLRLPSPVAVLLLVFALWLAAAPAARAAEAAGPVEVIQRLYAAQALSFAGKGPAVHAGGPASLAYFAPGLAAEMKAKPLDFDPIYNAQDADISDLTVAAHPQTPVQGDTALVVASFKNSGRPLQITYYLRRMPGGEWRIVDMTCGDWRLTELLKKNS